MNPEKPGSPIDANVAIDEQAAEDRDRLPQALVVGDRVRVAAFVQHPDEEEQRTRREPVRQHHEEAALDALLGEREEPEHHEAEVRNRRIRDDALQVGLHRRDDCAVRDADHRQHEQQRREVHRGLREHRDREAQQPVGAHLEQHAGEHDRSGGRRVRVRVREPRVQREQRHLHRERDHEREEQPLRGPARQRAARRGPRGERARVERQEALGAAVQERHREDADEQERGAGLREQEELHRGVATVVVAPARDEEVHRHQHDLEEHEEQDEVEREEHADERRFEQQHPGDEGLGPFDVGRREQPDRDEQRGQRDHEQADAVDADRPPHPERFHPRVTREELVARITAVEVEHQVDRDRERRHARRVAGGAGQFGAVVRHQHRDQRADRGEDDERREDREVHYDTARTNM